MGLNTKNILKWHGEGKLPLSSALKAVFLTDQIGDWQLMQERKKEKEEDSGEEGAEHASSTVKIKAVLSKSSSANYTGNFSYYARGDGKGRAGKVYNKISPNISYLYARNRPPLVKFISDYFTLDAVNCNFNSKSKAQIGGKKKEPGSKIPYAWEAHHMIPGEAFTSMKASVSGSEPIFNAKQYRLLLMSDYDINNGNNMIALPTNGMDFFQPVHNLIQHPSNHGNYTNRVVKEMKKVAKDLNQLTNDLEKPHSELTVKIAQTLKDLENELWRLLIKIGKAEVTAAVKGQEDSGLSEEDKKLIKSQTADGKTQYPMKALA